MIEFEFSVKVKKEFRETRREPEQQRSNRRFVIDSSPGLS